MYNDKFALSVSDFESGRFTKLARFVCRKWPSDDKPSLSEAQQIISKCLGYKDFHDAQKSAAHVASYNSNSNWEVARRLRSLNLLPYDVVEQFVESWPLHTIGLWNESGAGCTFNDALLSATEPTFNRFWVSKSSYYVGAFIKQSTSKNAPMVVAEILNARKETIDLAATKVSDILDRELFEAVFQDVMRKVIDDLLRINVAEGQALCEGTGLSVRDLWNLPRTEQGFPNLFAHLRVYAERELLGRPVLSLFTKERIETGFYTDILSPQSYPFDNPKVVTVDVGKHVLKLTIARDYLEDTPFKSYTWLGELQGEDGSALAGVLGTYIAGPAREVMSGFSLISAVDQAGDADIPIVDLVLTALREEIMNAPTADDSDLEELDELDELDEFIDDDEVSNSNINVGMLFERGNLVTLHRWERNVDAPNGLGILCLEESLKALKKKFKRNFTIAALISPSQYNSSADKLECLAREKEKDSRKIAEHLNILRRNTFVVGSIYGANPPDREGLTLFAQYCGEYYGVS